MERVQARPAATYDELVATRAPALMRLAITLTGSVADAEDLVQSTLARTFRHADRILAMAAPAAYLRRALVHEHVSWRRRHARRVPTRPFEEYDDRAAPTADLDDWMWRLLATLAPRQRAVLALRYYEDLDDAEIAAVLGCSRSTVRSQASRALATLRARLEEGS